MIWEEMRNAGCGRSGVGIRERPMRRRGPDTGAEGEVVMRVMRVTRVMRVMRVIR